MLDDAWWTLRTIFISIYPTNPGWQRSQRTMNGNLDKQKRFRWNQSPTIANINKTKLIRWFKSRTIWCCSPIRQYGTRFRSTHTLWYINKTERWIKIITQRSLWFKKRVNSSSNTNGVFTVIHTVKTASLYRVGTDTVSMLTVFNRIDFFFEFLAEKVQNAFWT